MWSAGIEDGGGTVGPAAAELADWVALAVGVAGATVAAGADAAHPATLIPNTAIMIVTTNKCFGITDLLAEKYAREKFGQGCRQRYPLIQFIRTLGECQKKRRAQSICLWHFLPSPA